MGLQWGHASSRVETDPSKPDIGLIVELQWGQASSRVGTCFTSRRIISIYIRFNGARSLPAWKPLSPQGSGPGLEALQWGHASSRVETPARGVGKHPFKYASMGPRVFTRGNVRGTSFTFFPGTASMGPRVFTRGNGARISR